MEGLSYTQGQIGIECVLDKREEWTSVLVYHLIDGKNQMQFTGIKMDVLCGNNFFCYLKIVE